MSYYNQGPPYDYSAGQGYSQPSGGQGYSQPPPAGQGYSQPPPATGPGYSQSSAGGQGYSQPHSSGQGYSQPPSGQGYSQPPSGQGYSQPPSGQGYSQPPPSYSSSYPQSYGSSNQDAPSYGYNTYSSYYGYNPGSSSANQSPSFTSSNPGSGGRGGHGGGGHGGGYGGYGGHGGRGGHFPKKQKTYKDPPVNIRCDTCGVSCASQEAYNAHIIGKKHAIQERKKLAPAPAPAAATADSTTPSSTSTNNGARFFCELCNCSSTDQGTFNLHLSGKKHQSTLLKQTKAADKAGQPSSAEVSGTTPNPSAAAGAADDDTSSQVSATGEENASASAASSSTGSTRSGGRYSPHYKRNRPSGPDRRHVQRDRKKPPSSTNAVIAGTGSSTFTRPVPVFLTMTPTNPSDDNLLNAKHSELTPSSATSIALTNLVQSISSRLSELGRNKEEFTAFLATNPIVVNEVKLVGAYARGTLMKHNPFADIVVITKDPPNTDVISFLHDVLMKTVSTANVTLDPESTEIIIKEEGYGARVMVTWLGAWTASKKIVIMVHEEDKVVEEKEEIKVVPTQSGPSNMSKTTTTTTTTTITTTTTTANQDVIKSSGEVTPGKEAVAEVTPAPTEAISAAPADTEMVDVNQPVVKAESPKVLVAPDNSLEHVNIVACQQALLSIRQMMWFNDHAMIVNIRGVYRLVMDFRERVSQFQPLSPWVMEVIIVNALRGTPPNSSISQSMRSLFAYIASGVLLPGVELIDPCEQEPVHVLRGLTPDQRLGITAVAQEIIREIAYGKWERIVGV